MQARSKAHYYTGRKPNIAYVSQYTAHSVRAFQIDNEGLSHSCESRLIQEAQRINHQGRMLVPIIDDAHLMGIDSLGKLRLLCEDFPKNHNLVSVAQPLLLHKLSLSVKEDIKSRVTYSVMIPKLNPDDMTKFVLDEMDRVALAHRTFTDDALSLIVRSSEGILRRVRNPFCPDSYRCNCPMIPIDCAALKTS